MTDTMIITGDCLETLLRVPDESIDAIVTDPPYGLSKQPDALEMLQRWLVGDDYAPSGSGFMGKSWDSFVPGPAVWCECLRVLKPGGHACVFAGSRTVDLIGLSMRIAGFEIRDQLQWLYGTGFPKSADFAKDNEASKAAGERVIKPEFVGHACAEGFGTALKPAHEPIILARRPLSGTIAATVLEHGTGALNIDGCRIGSESTARNNRAEMGYHGGNTAQEYSTGNAAGRWPANVILDEAAGAMLDEQSGERRSGSMAAGTYAGRKSAVYSPDEGRPLAQDITKSTGGASRFFYCAKASPREREAGLDGLRKASAGELTGNRVEGSDGLKSPRVGAGRTSNGRANVHPTVKPINLMRWLVRLVTPPGGTVLDPFTGSGTTGCACVLESVRFLGIELSPEYVEIAEARIKHWTTQP